MLLHKFIVEPCDSNDPAVIMFLCDFFVVSYLIRFLFLKFLFVNNVLVVTVEWDFCNEISLNSYWNLSINYFNMFSFI